VYGFKRDDIGDLTLTQTFSYLENIPYVLEWSENFGKPPSAEQSDDIELSDTDKESMITEMLCKMPQ
jgi:hypothetical protein